MKSKIKITNKKPENKTSKIKKIKKIKKAFEIGDKYFIRTCTYHYTCEIYGETDDGFLLLKDCAWVADSGRFSNAIKEGVEIQECSEIEPLDGLIIRLNKNCIESAIPYNHDLPNKQK